MCMYEFITLYEFVPEEEDGNVDFDAEMRVILCAYNGYTIQRETI